MIDWQLLKNQALDQDVALVEDFLDADAFAFKQVDPAEGSLLVSCRRTGGSQAWRVSPYEMPVVMALTAGFDNRFKRCDSDPDTGETLTDGFAVLEHRSHQAYLDVFKRVIKQFVESVPLVLQGNGALTFEANAAILLSMAIANGDKESAHALCIAAPRAYNTPLRTQLVNSASGDNNAWMTPVYMAYYCSHVGMLELFRAHGWTPQEVVRFRTVPHTGDKSALLGQASIDRDSTKTMAEQFGDDFFRNGVKSRLTPGFIRMMFNAVKEAPGQWCDGQGEVLRQIAVKYATQTDYHSGRELMQVFDDLGAFDGNIHDLLLQAAKRTDRQILERFRDRIDWSLFTREDFLPVIVCQALWVGDEPEMVAKLVTDLCHWCIEAGHGDMLANPNRGFDQMGEPRPTSDESKAAWHPYPVHLFAAGGITSAVILALEQGANPLELDSNDRDALSYAKQWGYTQTTAVMRSYLLRKEALLALESITSGDAHSP